MAKHLGLKYVYEEEQVEKVPVEHDVELSPEQLSPLPADLRSKLHKAVLRLDTAQTLAVIEQIAKRDVSIGDLLKKLAENLDYDRLLSLLESEDTNSGGAT